MQISSRVLPLSALALGVAAALSFGQAQAAGFQLKENSVKSLGTAFAGTAAKTGDSSAVVNNPALMTQFEGTTVQADLTVIDLNYEFKGSATDVLGRPMTGSNGGNAGDVTPIPAFSVVHKFENGTAIGAMVSAPFGLKTEYDAGWVGRYTALTSDVKIVDFTLSGAVDLTDHISIGIGAIYSRADVTLSKAVDFGAALNPALSQTADGQAVVQGDDNGLGWIVGLNIRPTENLSIGFSHRSEIDYELRGTVDWSVPGNVRTALDNNPLNPAGRFLFLDGDVGANLTTPSITSVGAAWQVSETFQLSATYARTNWSSLREVRINFDNPDPDSVEPFVWEDVEFAAIGGEFKLNDSFKLRAGVAYDESPTSIEHRTPRLPDANRMFYSIGATWAVSDALDVNLAYARIEPRDPKVNTPTGGAGRVVGDFDGNANLFGVSAQYRF